MLFFSQVMKLTFITLAVSINRSFPTGWKITERQLHKRPLHNEQVTVWCGVVKYAVCCPYFFEKGDHLVTVAPDQYVKMLWNFL